MNEGHQSRNPPMALRFLPEGLLRLSLADLDLEASLRERLTASGHRTVGDLLARSDDDLAATPEGETSAIRNAIAKVVEGGLSPRATPPFDPTDWPALQGHLLIPLDDDQRALLRALIGLDEPPSTTVQFARRAGIDLRAAEALGERVRNRLHARSRQLVSALQAETRRFLENGAGLLDPSTLPHGSMLHAMAEANDDPILPLRLAAFCFPHEFHCHGGVLVASTRRAMKLIVEQMHAVLQRRRLPLPLQALLDEITDARHAVPRGLAIHLLCHDLRMSVQETEDGEVILPDPRSKATRLAEILEEEGAPTHFQDIVFAYRERYRRASPGGIANHLRRDPTFILVGPRTFGLRRWYEDELERLGETADRAARHVCAERGKQDVLAWLGRQGCDQRTSWLVLDILRSDERVRLLGRGEACPATQRRSQVVTQLLADFRRACGDVVESLFVANQPPERRRLVQRLLAQNRLFVRSGPDRVDVLTNYPFTEARLRRLRKFVRRHLEENEGHRLLVDLVADIAETDLGGDWLTPLLLEEVLRRQGWFDVLPGGIVALSELELAARIGREARQTLREAGVQLSAEEIVRHRPELVEYADSIRALLREDPLVQSPDGRRFCLI